MDANEIEIVEENSPHRCQAVTGVGQCRKKRIANSQFCPIHLGCSRKTINDAKVRNLQLTVHRQRVHEKADASGITSLREEVGVLRVLLEEIWNSCITPVDLILSANKISDITIKIQKLVKDCHSLEKSIGMYLDKTSLLKLAGDIIDIITDHVEDPKVAEAIANDIIDKIIVAQPSEDVDKKDRD